MINWNEIILTSVFTIMGGVIVFCTSQIVLKFFIEPIQKLDMCRGEICDVLIFNRNIYLNPNTFSKEVELDVSSKIRKLATKLLSIKNMIRGNNFFSSLNLSLKEENIFKAHGALIGLSNIIGPISPNEVQNTIKIIQSYENEIIKALNIRIK